MCCLECGEWVYIVSYDIIRTLRNECDVIHGWERITLKQTSFEVRVLVHLSVR